MISFGLIFLFAIGIVVGSFALCTFLIGISRYLHDDPRCINDDYSILQCPQYRPGGHELEYVHVSGPWHG